MFLCACGSGSIGKFSLNINNNCTLLEPGEPLTTPDTPPAPEGMSFAGWTWTVRGETLDSMPATMPQADVIGMPIWVPNSYTLTIDGTSSQVAYGTTLTPPASPTAKGKSFTGWTWTVGGKKVATMPKTMPAANVTAVANWRTNSYTLTINGESKQVAYGTTLTAPAGPTADGKTFTGWTWTVDGKTVASMPATMPAATVTATPNWTVNSYTLTINGESKQVVYGTTLTVPAAPTAEGKTFTGWTWTVGGKTVASMPATMPAANVTAAANWTTNSYTLTINGESKQVVYGTTLTAPTAPTAEGKTFTGWTWTVGSTTVDAMPTTMPAANVTAAANWTTNSYTLTINGTSTQVAYGTALTAPADPTPETGYSFDHWEWSFGGITQNTMPATMPAADVTAKPIWKQIDYSMIFYDGYSNTLSNKTYHYGDTIVYPANPTHDGMEFQGWSFSVSGNPITMPAQNVTATATWKAKSYNLTINGTTTQKDYGADVAEPTAPTDVPTGYSFGGWKWTVGGIESPKPATMPAADVTAVPIWNKLYTVTFWLKGEELLEKKQYVEGETISPPSLNDGYKWNWTGDWIMPGYDLSINAVPIENPDGSNENPDVAS